MYVWYKDTNAEMVEDWERVFQGQPNMVIEYLKGGKSIRVRYFTETQEEAEAIRGQHGGSVREVEESEWNKPVAPPRPLNVRGKILLTSEVSELGVAEIRDANPGKIVLSIPAEMAFGTGDHATTSTCLRLLYDVSQERKKQAWSMVDIGTGTGVLAIAAKSLSAREVHAFDFDPFAVAASQRNVERNGVEGIAVWEQDVFAWEPKEDGYDVVIANLFSTVLIEAWPVIGKSLARGGDLIVSGILASQAWDVFTAAASHGLGFTKVVKKGKWVTARGGHMVDLIQTEG